MPLTDKARHYADEVFTKRQEEIAKQLQNELVEIRRKWARRNLVQSGGYAKSIADAHIEMVRRLAQARVETLVNAYERAGIKLNNEETRAVSDEAMQFTNM